MPKGYQCDDCGRFNRGEASLTVIDFASVYAQDGTLYNPTMTLCKGCAQELRDLLTGTRPPEEVLE